MVECTYHPITRMKENYPLSRQDRFQSPKTCYNGTFYKGNLSITVALLGPFCLAFSTSTSYIRVISL
ncbi:hypothetical protein P167DRAFT_534960 [Morchella conica CCBAS932]|uniref:Uncharacterized protein n=1 Tax=Morchella conica CCBAS932 TaxID=1392247 RepID=A0A3N4L6K7_9PEZI|nr:hypothetical protein P167DRAFT_534960 [Morchella conica CCBAS932]